MSIWEFLFGSSNEIEPNGKTDWLGNPVGGPASRGGTNDSEWWGPSEQQARNAEGGFWDGFV